MKQEAAQALRLLIRLDHNTHSSTIIKANEYAKRSQELKRQGLYIVSYLYINTRLLSVYIQWVFWHVMCLSRVSVNINWFH